MGTTRLIALIRKTELMLLAGADSSRQQSILETRRALLAEYEASGIPTLAEAVLGLRAAADVASAASNLGTSKHLRLAAKALETEGWTVKRADALWPLWHNARREYPDSLIPVAIEVATRGLPPRKKRYKPRPSTLTAEQWLARMKWRAYIRACNMGLFPRDPAWTPEKASERLRAERKLTAGYQRDSAVPCSPTKKQGRRQSR